MNTPTPWVFDKYGNILQEGTDSFTSRVSVEGVALGSSKEAKANSALIVRAVNAHQALVDALDNLLQAHLLTGRITNEDCAQADAALKLARGES